MQTRIMQEERELLREYSRASVWPSLELGLSKAHDKENGSITQLVFNLTNSGVGPAIITDVKVSYKGKTASDWWDLFEIQEIPDSIETYINNASFNRRIIKIGETFEVLNLNNNRPLAQAFFKRLEGLSFQIYYESIYGEVWKYELSSSNEGVDKLESFEGLPEEDQFE